MLAPMPATADPTARRDAPAADLPRPPVRTADQSRAEPHPKARGPAEAGLNVDDGTGDDGWRTPPPVRLADGTAVQLYKDGESLLAMYDAIRSAERRVCVEMYIVAGDETGSAFLDLLAAKAESGVEVWFMYDSFGTLSLGDDRLDRLRRAGARLAEFHPVAPWRCKYSWRPWNRNHRKLVIVDGERAGLGGQNLANEYAGPWVSATRLVVRKRSWLARLTGSTPVGEPPDPDDYWRDNAIGIAGPAVRHLERSFARTWRYVARGGKTSRAQTVHNLDLGRRAKGRRLGKQREDTTHPHLDPAGPHALDRPDDDFGLLASVPTLSSPLRPFLHKLIRESRKSIRLTMGYFGPDDAFFDDLCDAARRGVDVRLMLSGHTDIPLLMLAAQAFYPQMLGAGVKIYERQHVNLHAKSICLDGRVCVLGSANLDHRSIETNFELSAVIRSAELGRQMHALFENDVRFSEAIDFGDWEQRPWRDRLIRWAVSRLRYAL